MSAAPRAPICIVLAATLVGGLCLVATSCTGPHKTGSAPHAETREIMQGVVWDHYRGLLDGLSTPPPSAEVWGKLETHASLLCESSHVLLEHGHAPSIPPETWAHAAHTLGRGSAGTLTAVRAHDLVGARTAFEELNDACSSCHMECTAAYLLPWQ